MTEVFQSTASVEQLQILGADLDRAIEIENAKLIRGSRITTGNIPMIITTDHQMSRGADGNIILFWSGPQNTTWNFGQRGVVQQSRTGHIAHYWRDGRRSTFFDDPSINFTFQTGNIMPLKSVDGSLISLPPGLIDYYDFFEFMDEPKILSSGRSNFINIIYHSLLYPTILLRGFFDPETPITVTEEASRPASVTWQATFRVRETNPPFYNASKLKQAWHAAKGIPTLTQDDLNQRANATIQKLSSIPTSGIQEAFVSEAANAARQAQIDLADQERLDNENSLVDLITGD